MEWGGGGNHIPTKGHKNPEEMFYWNYTDRERKREREGREGRRERESNACWLLFLIMVKQQSASFISVGVGQQAFKEEEKKYCLL